MESIPPSHISYNTTVTMEDEKRLLVSCGVKADIISFSTLSDKRASDRPIVTIYKPN